SRRKPGLCDNLRLQWLTDLHLIRNQYDRKPNIPVVAQSFHLRNIRQSRRKAGFKCSVIAQKDGAPLQSDLQIGIVGECGPVIVICSLSMNDLAFEFAPTGQNIFDRGCQIRIADETPTLALEIIAEEKRNENSVWLKYQPFIGQQ